MVSANTRFALPSLTRNRRHSGRRRHRTIFSLSPHSWQPALRANRPEQMADLPRLCVFTCQPRADSKPPARLEDAGHLSKRPLLVAHVFGAFDRDHGVESARREIVGQPITQPVTGVLRLRVALRVLYLSRGDGNPRHHCAKLFRQHTRCAAVTASDIAHRIPFADVRPCRNVLDQLDDCALSALRPAQPQTVMNMLAPHLAIEHVQLVIVQSDARRCGLD